MSAVLGVDGARDGWAGALVEDGRVRWLRLATMRDVLAVEADVVGVDMPVGLPERGRREADLLAKARLGRAHPRIFLAPPRPVLDAFDYSSAGALHRTLVDGRGMSVQTWHLVPRIREVDAVADDRRLIEVHPELSFAALTGAVLRSKKTAAGRTQRLSALITWLPDLDTERVPRGDDAPDALAAAWSASRWLAGTAETLPDPAPVDAAGRPMRIVV